MLTPMSPSFLILSKFQSTNSISMVSVISNSRHDGSKLLSFSAWMTISTKSSCKSCNTDMFTAIFNFENLSFRNFINLQDSLRTILPKGRIRPDVSATSINSAAFKKAVFSTVPSNQGFKSSDLSCRDIQLGLII